jgi:maltose alpha-D-glucosyltransferase/alpha-amylase
MADSRRPETDASWLENAVIYQLPVKSFCDGDGDGVGDFKGLASKLDYLENLGVTVVWLSPFFASPLRDDGYDVSDFTAVHPRYGRLGDFKRFLAKARERGLKVAVELPLNHTSDEHPWFQRSRKAKPGSAWADYYIWSDTPARFPEARIVLGESERSNWAWDPEAKAYYFHRFYSFQPDLNYDSPRVREAMLQVADFWLELGVDALRLDGVAFLFKREGTDCENLPETYAFLQELRRRVDEKFPGRVLLAEANQWPEDAARYFGDGAGCQVVYHFPLMPRMFMALEMEDRYPVAEILEQTPEAPEGCRWALFLRNHDELTLEMVTDEERDYMHRTFLTDPRARLNLGIRRRLAPLLGNERAKIELLNVLLMTLPGVPVIYYGDEIGMGDNHYLGDRDGVRTPMQWSADANAGFSRANPQQLHLPVVIDPEYHYTSLNVATQERRRSSLLWWMRRIISLRRRSRALNHGELRILDTDNPKILAFLRATQDEQVLVAANLSRHVQMAELDLSEAVGATPEDLFSRNRLKPVGDGPYPLTFGPHQSYVFTLAWPEEPAEEAEEGLPVVRSASWSHLLDDAEARRAFEERILPRYMRGQRWYGGKARRLLELTILDVVRVRGELSEPHILLAQASYQEGDPEIYVLPLAFAPRSEEPYETPTGAVAWLETPEGEGAVYEAVFSRRFSRDLLSLMAGRKRIGSSRGRLQAVSGRLLREVLDDPEADLTPRLLGAEQSNTSIVFGDRLVFKLYRRTEQGVHPDLEIVRHLTERCGFRRIPEYAGALEHRPAEGEPVVLGLMQRFVPNQGEAWRLALDAVGHFLEHALTRSGRVERPPAAPASLLEAGRSQPEAALAELLGARTLEWAELLGRRTGEMHLALAREDAPEAFKPEPFTTHYQRSLFQAMQARARHELRGLAAQADNLPHAVRPLAREAAGLGDAVIDRMRHGLEEKLPAKKIRIHGDYHLGQVLFTGQDFIIFDFEGEPARPLSERRLKRAPVRDAAGMLRSFHYAAYTSLLGGQVVRRRDAQLLQPWAELWYQYVGGRFAAGYLDTVAGSGLLPDDESRVERLLVPFLLEKAVYELGYELNNRPDWLVIPLRGVKQLAGSAT